MTPSLQLKDVHEGIAPGWWPPAPGWWIVCAAVALAVALLAWRRLRRRRRAAAILRLFDDALAHADTPSQQVAAMSELLRRAARRKDANAATLEGEAWLRFLDEGMPQPVFVAGIGSLLLDGGFRADVSRDEADALRAIARDRYLRWMRGA